MREKELKEHVETILKEIENLEVADGMDILSVAISHVITTAVASGLFKKEDVDAYFHELTKRINKVLGTAKPVQIGRAKDIKIVRQGNT